MKIAVLTHTLPRYSGDPSAPFIEVLLNAISEYKQKIFAIVPYDEKFNTKHRRNFQILIYKYIYPNHLHQLGYSKTLRGDKTMSLLNYLVSPFLYFFGFIKLLKTVKQKHVDVISAHWILPNGFIAALVSKLTNIPFTVTIPGSDIFMAGKNVIFKKMAGFAANNAQFVISDSDHYLKELNQLGYYPKQTQVIRYGVDVSKFKVLEPDNALQNSLKISKKDKIILAVGRMVAKKGFVYLIKAMPEIIKENPNFKLLMVGDGEERKSLEKLAIKNKTINNVNFVGTISYNDLVKYYNLADVFVMPSIKDNKGNIDASPVSMMEAMACGVPVVATNFSGNSDLVVEGKSGFLVKEKDSKQIANAVLSLLKNVSKKNKSLVRKIAVENFSSKVIAKRYIKIFNKIGNNKG